LQQNGARKLHRWHSVLLPGRTPPAFSPAAHLRHIPPCNALLKRYCRFFTTPAAVALRARRRARLDRISSWRTFSYTCSKMTLYRALHTLRLRCQTLGSSIGASLLPRVSWRAEAYLPPRRANTLALFALDFPWRSDFCGGCMDGFRKNTRALPFSTCAAFTARSLPTFLALAHIPVL